MNTYSLDRGMYAQPTIMETGGVGSERLHARGDCFPAPAQKLVSAWGSDRIEVVRHLEFLKFLVKTGKLL